MVPGNDWGAGEEEPEPELELDLDRVRAVRVLGRGAMGTVFLATNRSSHLPAPFFALKVFEKRSPRPDAERRARWEMSVLRQLRHPNLPRFLGSAEDPDLIGWALPYCPGGDLNALRQSLPDRVLSPSALIFYLSELVLAISHLHNSLFLAYRDLKPENVLLRADGHLLLSDFDLSRRLSPRAHSPLIPILPDLNLNLDSKPPPPRRHRRNLTRIFLGSRQPAEETARDRLKKARSARVSPVSRRRTIYSGERSNSFVGTEEYVAPEVVRGEGHEFSVDWWALGILAYEMAYGKTPFRGRNRKETFHNVLTRHPEFPRGGSSELNDLIARLLAKDPERRLGFAGGAEEVKAHPFFRGVRWDLLAEVGRPPYIAPVEDDADLAGEEFDIRDYFKRLRIRETAPPSPPSASMDEF